MRINRSAVVTVLASYLVYCAHGHRVARASAHGCARIQRAIIVSVLLAVVSYLFNIIYRKVNWLWKLQE